jgi:acetyl-CoA carboxylase biotin carboxyl carrier protein
MDLERIEGLLKLMHEYSVAELELSEEDTGLHLRLMEGGQAAAVAPVIVAAAPVAPAAATGGAQAAALSDDLTEVKSPMVGTFYRSSKPGSPSFVKVGDRIEEGQVLCIVEAMKLMNELETEVAGTIREILVENAQPVQFGQILFHIQTD